MKLVRAQGGMGNQIFQYAYCKYLAMTSGEEVLLDVSQLHRYDPPRIYSLEGLFSDARHCVASESNWPLLPMLSKFAARHIRSTRILDIVRFPGIITETSSRRAPELLASGSYYVGYWQLDALVELVKHELLDKILYATSSEKAVLNINGQQLTSKDVAIHVRRGDYVTNSRAALHHGALPVEYYEKAVELAISRGCNRAFLFSDDLCWAAQNLSHLPIELVIANPAGQGGDICEIKLMMEFRNHIIANSTFSWWAARLGKYKDRESLTIAPQRWFREGDAPVFPISWVMT